MTKGKDHNERTILCLDLVFGGHILVQTCVYGVAIRAYIGHLDCHITINIA